MFTVMIGTNNGGRDEKGIATAVLKIVDVISLPLLTVI